MKAPSPLVGFNNNVKHKGRVFHIQTEDSGIKHPHIITHLFADGGRILKTTKTSYAEHIGAAAMAETVRAMMQEQHKAMFIALRDGQFDPLIDEAGGRSAATNSAGKPAPAAVNPAPATSSPAPATSNPAPAAVNPALPTTKPAPSLGGARLGTPAKSDPTSPPSMGAGLAELRAALKPLSAVPMPGDTSPTSRPKSAMAALFAESSPPGRAQGSMGSTPSETPITRPRGSMGSTSDASASVKPSEEPPPSARSRRIASRPKVPINPANLLSPRSPPSNPAKPRDWAPSAAATATSSGGIDLDLDALERAASDAQTPFFKRIEDLPPPPASVLGTTRAGTANASAAGAYRSITTPLPGSSADAQGPTSRAEIKTPSVPPAARYAPSRPASIFANNRPTEGMSIFGGEEISEKSLDEVILSYLAEDLDSSLPPKK